MRHQAGRHRSSPVFRETRNMHTLLREPSSYLGRNSAVECAGVCHPLPSLRETARRPACSLVSRQRTTRPVSHGQLRDKLPAVEHVVMGAALRPSCVRQPTSGRIVGGAEYGNPGDAGLGLRLARGSARLRHWRDSATPQGVNQGVAREGVMGRVGMGSGKERAAQPVDDTPPCTLARSGPPVWCLQCVPRDRLPYSGG
jgi:hypothetical protein